jgi:Protein of unknown function (DUF1579)
MTQRNRARALGAVLLLALPAATQAQERKPTPEEIAKLQATMMESMKPGPEHERLARLVGRWNLETRIWPEPGAQPMTVTGAAENRMILGGRFLVSETTTSSGPMQGESMTIFGFDRRNDWYTSAGYDTFGTYHVAAQGTWDAARGAIVMHGEDTVVEGNHTQTWDFVLRPVDEDTYVFEIIFTDPWHTRGGPPFKMVEITHRRQK